MVNNCRMPTAWEYCLSPANRTNRCIFAPSFPSLFTLLISSFKDFNCWYMFFKMSKLTNINDDFLLYFIYLTIFTGLLTVHFLPLTLFLRIPLKMFSFFCLINIYFINMDCNPSLSQNSARQWSFVPDWEDGVDVTQQWHLRGTSKCVCGSRNTLFWCILLPHGAWGTTLLQDYLDDR